MSKNSLLESRFFFIISLITIFIVEVLIFLNSQFTLWPEMVIYPWLVNNNFKIYQDIINPYFPLLTLLLSWVTKTFGYHLNIFIYFTWGYIAICQLVLIGIVANFYKEKRDILFILITNVILLFIFEGNGLWFDLVSTLPLFLAFHFLLKDKYFFAGVLLGTSLLIKQTAIWPVLVSILFIANQKNRIKQIFFILAPIFFLFVITAGYFYYHGSFIDFFSWTLMMAFGGIQRFPGFIQFPTGQNLILMAIAFWPVGLFIRAIISDKVSRTAFIFFLSTVLFAFPRFGYFHLVASIPFYTVAVSSCLLKYKKIMILYLSGVLMLGGVMFRRSNGFSIRFFEKSDIQLANLIKIETRGKKFYILNAPVQIYFINQVLPLKPWAINFPWYLEVYGLEEKILRSLETEKIDFIVDKKYPGAYVSSGINTLLNKHYKIVKKAGDILLYQYVK